MLTTLLGGRAFAESFGEDAPRVVALHGWGRSRADWSSTLEGFDALALDLPGFGATPAPEYGWETAAYAGWLAEILSDLDRPVLVGHSFGGRVAVQLAAARPEMIGGLVLTGVPLYRLEGGRGRTRLGYRLGKALNAKGLLSADRMESLRQRYGSADYRSAAGVMRDVLVKAVNEDYTVQVEDVAAVGLPTRLVWGEGDTGAPVWMAQRAGGVLGVEPTIVRGSAHLLDAGLVAALRTAIEELT